MKTVLALLVLSLPLQAQLSFRDSGPAAEVTPDSLNRLFGVPIWSDDDLWDDAAPATAERIGIPEESKTSTTESYRAYPSASSSILGARPFSVALYGTDGTISSISMVFSNKGDIAEILVPEHGRDILSDSRRALRELERSVEAEAEALEERLTTALGEPSRDKFGTGTQTRERVKRWDWNGHSILLAAPDGEYVGLRVVPTSLADGEDQQRFDDAEIREAVTQRIQERPNGDVVLTDVPMVDQGPKGYCVPATWERALRYMGVPADMYVLAMAGDTKAGGGTYIDDILLGAGQLASRYGRRMKEETGRLNTNEVRRNIDEGLPMLWSVVVDQPLQRRISERTKERSGVDDIKQWDERLEPVRSEARNADINPVGYHVCMIVGYNPETEEIAISDSYGPGFEERWLTEEEAQLMHAGKYYLISW